MMRELESGEGGLCLICSPRQGSPKESCPASHSEIIVNLLRKTFCINVHVDEQRQESWQTIAWSRSWWYKSTVGVEECKRVREGKRLDQIQARCREVDPYGGYTGSCTTKYYDVPSTFSRFDLVLNEDRIVTPSNTIVTRIVTPKSEWWQIKYGWPRNKSNIFAVCGLYNRISLSWIIFYPR